MSFGSLPRTGRAAALTIGVAGGSYAVSWPLLLAVIAAVMIVGGTLLLRMTWRQGRSVSAAGAVLAAPPAHSRRGRLARLLGR